MLMIILKIQNLILTSYKNEFLRISEYLDNETEIENKIKKTYKNRYFVKQKNLN